MDRFTPNQQCLAFAKICVEVEVSMDVPRISKVELCDGSVVHVYVDIPWLHVKCSHV